MIQRSSCAADLASWPGLSLYSTRAPTARAPTRAVISLLLAIQGGFEPIVQVLVERGCQIDYFNEWCHLWSFPLGEASRAGQASTVSLLLEHGAQLDMTDMIGRNALHLAAFNDRPEVCALLIAKGFDPTVQDDKGRTALSHYGYFLTDDYSGWADPNAHETDELQQDCASMEFFDVDTFSFARLPFTDEAKQERVTQLKQLVVDYHWGRRAAFMHTLVGSGIRLTAAQTTEHALIQAASDKSAKIPPIPRKTKAQNIAYLNTQIFGAEGFVRKIAEYL